MTSRGTASSFGLVAASWSGATRESQPPEATPRPASVSAAEVAPASPKVTGPAERSLTSLAAAWTGTRRCVSPEVSTRRPEMLARYSRGRPPCVALDVTSRVRARFAGSAVSVTVTSRDSPAGTVTEAGDVVIVAPPSVVAAA